MIILRTKQYSKATKLMAGFKKVSNAGMTKLDNAGLKAGNAVKQVFTGKAPSYGVKQGFAPKTAMQVKREAVQAVKDIKAAPNKIATTPVGVATNKAVKATIKRPDVVGIAALGEASTPVGIAMGGPVGTAMAAPWNPPVLAYVKDHPLIPKKVIPKLEKITERYGKSKFAQRLDRSSLTFGDLAANAHNIIPL